MSNVTRLRHVLPLSTDVVVATNALDTALIKAIDVAKEAGLAQRLLVGLLHGHAHGESHRMVAR
ncbi:hypothetical protein CHR29_16550 [Pseudomonas monteilii]|uniref:Uncharacterized protein n=1 Tax=Pseudomonas monteilii TaxID=76759 RepID=A0AAP7KEF0_9PSED|nr:MULTISPECIES: hypothetical protein [Pseudomonas]AYN16668.1 hypothetical protein CHR29_16550 [Pseudomonas monteilii]AYN99657.1 hypothetical protein D8767_12050 [Pseudomonas sp. LTGT-11-2Z]MBA6091292.1 hypothetical protein [Pseudomonas monteilii]MBA6102139.1 hypothetical protein [Pseudomonas monteilii]MCE0873704.1 hypothetical protein [Pseudomonas monteilii]